MRFPYQKIMLIASCSIVFTYVSGQSLLMYTQNKNTQTIDAGSGAVSDMSYTANGIYEIVNFNELKKCDINGANCQLIDTYKDDDPIRVSFDNNGNGYVLVQNHNNEDGGHLDQYINDTYVGQPHIFDDTPLDMSYTGNAIYVVTNTGGIFSNPGQLKMCVVNGNLVCNTMDSFPSETAVSVSFDSNGHGYVVNANGDIDIYDNNKYTKQVKGNQKLLFVKYFGGNSVYLYGEGGSNGYKPQRCDINLENCQSFTNLMELETVSFDNQGSGAVLTTE